MKTKKVTVWAAIISMAVIVIIILVFATSANKAERDEQISANTTGEETTPSADSVNNAGNATHDDQTGEDSVISSNSADDTYYLPGDGWPEVTGEDVIAFFDTITEDMLAACDEYPSVESYWDDPIILLNRQPNMQLYGISANGQDAMLLYIDGEKILIKRSFRNLYQWRPELNMYDIDYDGKQEVIISVITLTGNPVIRYGMLVCDYTDIWNVYVYEDYLKDIEEAIQWQYDEQEKSVLFMNDENIILTEVKLPEWTEEYPFAGNVIFNNYFIFSADLMRLRVEPFIELEQSMPYRPIEIVFQVNFDNGDFSLGSYYIYDTQRGQRDPETTVEPIGTEYTGKIENFSIPHLKS